MTRTVRLVALVGESRESSRRENTLSARKALYYRVGLLIVGLDHDSWGGSMTDELLWPLLLIGVGGLILVIGFGWQWRRDRGVPWKAEEENQQQTVPPVQHVVRADSPVTKEVYKEREIIREIVKVRCRNCGTLFEEKLNRCPHCGAPP